eukprot:COSAG04_NODE_264_length_18606_cov_9.965256_24_plen_89_part_00
MIIDWGKMRASKIRTTTSVARVQRTTQSEDESEPSGDVWPVEQLVQDVRSLRSYLPAAHQEQLDLDDVSCFPAGHKLQLVEVWLEEDW